MSDDNSSVYTSCSSQEQNTRAQDTRSSHDNNNSGTSRLVSSHAISKGEHQSDRFDNNTSADTMAQLSDPKEPLVGRIFSVLVTIATTTIITNLFSAYSI